MSCKSQNSSNVVKNNLPNTKQKIMEKVPTVNLNFEKIDLQKIKDSYLNQLNSKGNLINNSEIANTYDYEEKINNKTTKWYLYEIVDKKYEKEFGKGYATETIYYDNLPFFISKTFYSNGNIKEKGVKIVSGNVYKGIWYYFDESGKLIHSIDNDKIFDFSWEDILKFMTENRIPIQVGNSNHGRNSINRFSPFIFPQSSEKDSTQKYNKPIWNVTYRGDTFNQYYDLILDASNGKMLYRKKYWISEQGESVTEPILEDFTSK